MIANTLFAASAFVSIVAAIPMAQPPFPKRDVVWETHTEVAMTTIPVTVTHWLEPGETPPTVGKNHYGHGHGHGGHGKPPAQPETTEPAAPSPPASSPESVPQAPAPSSYEQPAPPPAAPTTTQAPPPAAPTTQPAAPPAYTPQPSPEPQPSPPSNGGGSNGLSGMAAAGKSYTGDLTYYAPGLGACGVTSGPSEAIVAISEAIFDAYLPASGNPNLNPLCGKSVSITGEDGSSYTAKIVDRCPGCAQADLDLSPDFFKKVVPTGDGRVPGVKWVFA